MPLKSIKEHWGPKFQTDRCKSKGTGCTFCASANSEHVILDCDVIKSAYGIPGKMSDCIIIENQKIFCVCVLEFKGRSYRVSDARLQLEEGIKLAKSILRRSNCRRYKIFPILVSKDFRDGRRAQALKSSPIVIDGKKLRIVLSTCNRRFSDFIPKEYLSERGTD